MSDLREEVDVLGRVVDEQEQTIAALRDELDRHEAALGWRLQSRLEPVGNRMRKLPVVRQIYRTLHRALELWVDDGFAGVFRQAGVKFGLLLRGDRFLVESARRPRSLEEQYEIWIRHHGTPNRRDVAQAIAGFNTPPLVSVLTVFDGDDFARFVAGLATLQAQFYERWELCASVPPATRTALQTDLDDLLTREPRLHIVLSAGDRPTLADAYRVAAGDFVAFLQTDDELPPQALFELVHRLQREPNADVVYSDEDVISVGGRRAEPLFKPDWSPVLLLSINYLERFALLRRQLVDNVGGFSAEFGPGQSYDLVLRLTEKTDRIVHVPKVLYHRRSRPTTLASTMSRRAAIDDDRCALMSTLARRGLRGHVSALSLRRGARCYATRFELADRPLVSIIIPTRNNRPLLQNAIESIRRVTEYERYEILVIDNGSTSPDAIEYLASLPPGCQCVPWNEPFNYSAINNFGVRHAQGEQLLFLNDDVEVISPDWLTAMLEHAQRPEVGAVGARLLYADGRIQHAGVVVGVNRGAVNAFRRRTAESGSPSLAELVREVSAVTGACMMMRREVFERVNGFDEGLPVIFNDVDLCLRIRQNGYTVLYTPHARLYHYEGSSRGRRNPNEDRQIFQERWAQLLTHGDPYYNPNLTDTHDDWSLRLDDRDDVPVR
jgi:O-antigen biosynthesis protein